MIYSEICNSVYLDVQKTNSGVFDPALSDLYRYRAFHNVLRDYKHL